jgi:hypothetical protein
MHLHDVISEPKCVRNEKTRQSNVHTRPAEVLIQLVLFGFSKQKKQKVLFHYLLKLEGFTETLLLLIGFLSQRDSVK